MFQIQYNNLLRVYNELLTSAGLSKTSSTASPVTIFNSQVRDRVISPVNTRNNLLMDISTVSNLLSENPSQSLKTKVDTILAITGTGWSPGLQCMVTATSGYLMDGGATIKSKVETIFTDLGYSSTYTIKSKISSLNTSLGSEGSVENRVNNLNGILDQTISSVPSTLIVSSLASLNNDGDTISLPTNDGTYTYTYSSPINDNSPITFSNGTRSFVVFIKSGDRITSPITLLNYIRSTYPSGSRLSLDILSRLTSIKSMIGGNNTDIRTSISSVDRSLVDSPTGVLRTDISTLRNKLVTTSTSNMESDISTLNSMIGGNGDTLSTNLGYITQKLGSTTIDGYDTFNNTNNINGKLQAFIDKAKTSNRFTLAEQQSFSSETTLGDLLTVLFSV